LHPAARFIVVIWSDRLGPNGSYTLPPIEATGSGSVQEKQQATSNSKEQFANLPDLKDALLHAIMDAPTTMSTQALGSERVREDLHDILLGLAQLYEALRARTAVTHGRKMIKKQKAASCEPG
jgi:hypothetical protein